MAEALQLDAQRPRVDRDAISAALANAAVAVNDGPNPAAVVNNVPEVAAPQPPLVEQLEVLKRFQWLPFFAIYSAYSSPTVRPIFTFHYPCF